MNVLNIGKAAVQQSGIGNVKMPEEDVKISFLDVMGRMTASNDGNDVSGDTQAVPGVEKQDQAVPDSVDYDRYRSRDCGIREKDRDMNAVDRSVAEEYAEDVKDVISETYGVSKEQIEQAMELLGLTNADLMNPNQLAALAAELTGCQDAGELLCSSQFMEVMQAVGTLTESLLKELGITREGLAQMLETSQPEMGMEGQPADDVPVQPAGNETAGPDAENTGNGDTVTAQTADNAEMAAEQSKTQMKAQTTDPASAQVQNAAQNNAEQGSGKAENEKPETVVPAGPETPDKTVGQTTEESSGEGGTEQNANEAFEEPVADTTEKNQPLSKENHLTANNISNGHGEVSLAQQNTAPVTNTQGAQPTAAALPQVDVADIIRQITEFSRMTVAKAETTMEMQLNPEHLGKIYLEVTAREGNVSARIVAQNEVVKEALETQMAELKQNMNQAGIKVDAVEVTVGSHEFERNLEQQAKQEEQRAEEQEKLLKQTRRINLNDLDELGGILSEEESLVARIMSEQGNSIDYTA